MPQRPPVPLRAALAGRVASVEALAPPGAGTTTTDATDMTVNCRMSVQTMLYMPPSITYSVAIAVNAGAALIYSARVMDAVEAKRQGGTDAS